MRRSVSLAAILTVLALAAPVVAGPLGRLIAAPDLPEELSAPAAQPLPEAGGYSSEPPLVAPQVGIPEGGDAYWGDPHVVYDAPPAFIAAAPECCPLPKIRYRKHGRLARKIARDECAEAMEIVLSIPGECCPVEVPVRVPLCCDCPPEYTEDKDLLRRCTYEYCWPCGYRVKVVDRHRGDILVHTFGK